MLQYQNIKMVTLQIYLKKFFAIAKVKNNVPWTCYK